MNINAIAFWLDNDYHMCLKHDDKLHFQTKEIYKETDEIPAVTQNQIHCIQLTDKAINHLLSGRDMYLNNEDTEHVAGVYLYTLPFDFEAGFRTCSSQEQVDVFFRALFHHADVKLSNLCE